MTTLSANLIFATSTLLLGTSAVAAPALAEQNGWFGGDKPSVEKAKPAAKPAENKSPENKSSENKSSEKKEAKDTASDRKEPAVKTAEAAPAKQPDLQTMEQLSKAGVKRCLQIAQAVGQATMLGTKEYAAASTWNSKQPDNRFSVSMIGQKFNSADASIVNGVSGVFSSPTSEGKCDAAAIQIIPSSDSCAKTQAQILEKGKALGNLAGVPIFQNAANAQVMLIPAANNTCVLVALSTVYTE